MVAKELDMKIKWKGKGIKEKAYNEKNESLLNAKQSI